jgi:chloramphenicol 3-O-phosphotransferase
MSAKFLAALIGIWPLLAWTCGVCDEDKVAATYDHAVISRAAAARQTVVFVAVDSPVEPQAFARRVASVAPRVRGVLRGSVRTAIAPVAFSFVLDPAVQTPASAVAELRRLLSADSDLRILRIVSAPPSRG